MRGKGLAPGRGRGRGGRGKGKRRRMLGFLQPCILLQLNDQDKHGYELLLGLGQFMEDAEEYDPSIIYRLMKDMEVNGFVNSYEGDTSRGPRRKMYHLTEEGRLQLERWVVDLKRSREEIDRLLAAHDKQSRQR
ncbi:PadR family transcriptional regulator [Desulfopila sp. IMCC35008]|uniref:PadR family transcriptional regulator n=1 Tax=Desulfopila sp. IMCC35008 TaxID=2653858 RepID=UPI0013D3F52F|nr:PadR family transcriptional regulator [Desulfopila sp. IMCC35008]